MQGSCTRTALLLCCFSQGASHHSGPSAHPSVPDISAQKPHTSPENFGINFTFSRPKNGLNVWIMLERKVKLEARHVCCYSWVKQQNASGFHPVDHETISWCFKRFFFLWKFMKFRPDISTHLNCWSVKLQEDSSLVSFFIFDSCRNVMPCSYGTEKTHKDELVKTNGLCCLGSMLAYSNKSAYVKRNFKNMVKTYNPQLAFFYVCKNIEMIWDDLQTNILSH